MLSKSLKHKRIYIGIGVAFLLSLLPIQVFADIMSASNPVCTITDAQNDETKIKNWVGECNLQLIEGHKNITFVEATSQTGTNGVVNVDVRVNMQGYKEFSTKEQQEIFQIVFKTITDSQMSKTSQNKIYNFISSQDKAVSSLVRQLSEDTNADFYRAYQWWKPFSGPVSVALGIIAVLILVTLSLTILLDLAFLTIPAFTWFCMTTTKKDKPMIVSNEAFEAMKQSEASSGQDFKASVPIYFKLKSVQLIAISICLLYLVSGQLFDVVANVVDYFRGFLIKQ